MGGGLGGGERAMGANFLQVSLLGLVLGLKGGGFNEGRRRGKGAGRMEVKTFRDSLDKSDSGSQNP